MTPQKALENLTKAKWTNLRLWEGDSVDQIYVTSMNGYDCGFIQFNNGGVWYDNITKHRDLIRKAAEGQRTY